MIESKLIAHSRNPEGGQLLTYILKYPRFIHAELMTHRALSRNAASSRAIPIQRMIADVIKEPACPEFWGKNQKGMQAATQLGGLMRSAAKRLWKASRWLAVGVAYTLYKIGLHKQIANRVLEPWSHITVIVTGSDRGFRNFFGLRAHKDAQPEFQILAYRMLRDYLNSTPRDLLWGEWHIPFADGLEDEQVSTRLTIATGRIARISYLTHAGIRDVSEDVRLHDSLSRAGHWSPFEHCAEAVQNDKTSYSGNFGRGWSQYRKRFLFENRNPTDQELKEMLNNRPTWFDV